VNRSKHRSIHDPRYQSFIGQLVKLRKGKGVSQRALAERLRVLQSDISKIEQCQRRIDLLETLLWLEAIGEADPCRVLSDIVQHFYANSGGPLKSK
jgi:transcriptional regulator with XRE-family HTH domain